MACPTTNTDKCGCKVSTSTKCVNVSGIDSNCAGVNNGQTLTVALNNILEYFCDNNPSGHYFDVDSCNGNITVSTETVGSVTTHTICLSSALVTQINNNTTNVATLDSCIENGVLDITTGTPDYIDITETDTDDCGRTLNINFNPSGNAVYEGIIYNDNTKSGTSGAGGVQILKTYNHDYNTSNNLSIGDEIRYQIVGQIDTGANGLADIVTLELFNSNTASVIDTVSFSAFNSNADTLSSFIFDGVIVKNDTTDGRHTVKFMSNAKNNTILSSTAMSMKAYDVGVIDFTALTIRVKFTNNSLSTSGNNYVHKLMVEVRKKI